jgi:hypothetical protein
VYSRIIPIPLKGDEMYIGSGVIILILVILLLIWLF